MDDRALQDRLAAIADPKRDGDIVASGRVAGLTMRAGTPGFVLDISGLDKDELQSLRTQLDAAVPAARIITTQESAAPKEVPRGRPVPHEQPAAALPNVKHIVAVASGKGGVGKSTVAANLAVAMAQTGLKVGLLDADIYGPSVPTVLGAHERAEGEQGRIIPIKAHGLKLLSIAALTKPGQAVIWRGPMAAAAMMQMLNEADWGPLDVLVIDMPPGTGDIQLSLAQKIRGARSVIVSTPQDLALIDAEKAIAMFGKVGIPILGIIENMSLFHCPECGTATAIFGEGGAKETSAKRGVPFLGAVPLTMQLRESADAGMPAVLGEGPAADALNAAARALMTELEIKYAATD
ncbi:MAG: Mrp/NBP35 family ATP-binding protein [Pacificimonas sp.]